MNIERAADPDPEAGSAVSLPAGRSFVVQFRAPSDGEVGPPWAGRVEHLVSGRAVRFDDWSALRRFVEHVLLGEASRAPTPPERDASSTVGDEPAPTHP